MKTNTQSTNVGNTMPQWLCKLQAGLARLGEIALQCGAFLSRLSCILAPLAKWQEWISEKHSRSMDFVRQFGTWISAPEVQAVIHEFLPGGLVADSLIVLQPGARFEEKKKTAALEHVAAWRSEYWKAFAKATADALHLYATERSMSYHAAKQTLVMEAIVMVKADQAKRCRSRVPGWRADRPPLEQSLPVYLNWFFAKVAKRVEIILSDMYPVDQDYQLFGAYSARSGSSDPARIYENDESEREILDRLTHVSPLQRNICLMALENLSRAEIAELLELDGSRLRVELHRLRPKLEPLLKPRKIEAS